MAEVKRDARYNSSDGKARQAPDVKVTGAKLVAKVLGNKVRDNDDQQNRDRGLGGARFKVEDGNHAYKIDHDAAPK